MVSLDGLVGSKVIRKRLYMKEAFIYEAYV